MAKKYQMGSGRGKDLTNNTNPAVATDTADAKADKPEAQEFTSVKSEDEPEQKPADNKRGRQNNQNRRNNQNKKKAPGVQRTPKVVEVAPVAQPAHMRRRHWGLVFSFLVFVLLPLVVTAWYLWNRAADQYASTVGFTVRQEGNASSSSLLDGFAASITGGSNQSDTNILYEFIQSQGLVAEINKKFDLKTIYNEPFAQDPVFSIKANASIEDLVSYWSRIVRISYDEANQLIELRVLAFAPETAQSIAREILAQSQVLINDLNAKARADTIRYSQEDLSQAQRRLKKVREALIVFRTRTQIVDPETDLQGRMGVVNTLQQQLAEALIDFDLLSENTGDNDPRVEQANRRIRVIRDRIAQERKNVTSGDESVDGKDYPTLLAEYEGLVVDREFAEQTYTASLAGLDVARANAARQSIYLATYVSPTYPETAEFPQRWTLFGLTALFLILSWTIIVLIYYSVRDSR